MRNLLLIPSTFIIGLIYIYFTESDKLRKTPLHSLEGVRGVCEHHHCKATRVSQRPPGKLPAEQGSPKRLDNTGYWVQGHYPSHFFWDKAHRVDNRRNKYPYLNQKRKRVSHIPISNVQRRNPYSDSKSKQSGKNDKRKKHQVSNRNLEVVIDEQAYQQNRSNS